MLLVVSVSMSNEELVQRYGYRLIPLQIDFTAYRMAFRDPGIVIDAYAVTAFQAFAATLLGLYVMSSCAYAVSRKYFKLRTPIVFGIFFTMLFSGGLIPSYILIKQYYHLANTIWVYIFPVLANAFYIIIFRTFFQGLPDAISDSAKIDGAGEFRIFFQINLPLSKPVLATIGLFMLLDRWNDWFTSLVYIDNTRLYTLQYLLQRILMDIEFVKSQMSANVPPDMNVNLFKLPSETLRFAMAVIAAGPLLLVFPFFQKYFARGLTVGSIKG